VGPNGSGKSNVIDAMLFVFGKRAKQVTFLFLLLQYIMVAKSNWLMFSVLLFLVDASEQSV
jgi:AAA15 family ATPase/GTPase